MSRSMGSTSWHPPPLTADQESGGDASVAGGHSSEASDEQVLQRTWDDKDWSRAYEEMPVCGTSACFGGKSECLIFRPVVVPHMQRSGDQEAMGETSGADPADNVTGNWTEVRIHLTLML